MTPQIVLTLALVAGALILFGTEKSRIDIIALMVILTVALTGLVGPEQAFAGFANPAVITVWVVYIVSGGLIKPTGPISWDPSQYPGFLPCSRIETEFDDED